MSNFIIRVATSTGQLRVELPKTAQAAALFAKISEFTSISPTNIQLSFDNKSWFKLPSNTSLASMREFHEEGVRVFAIPIAAESAQTKPSSAAAAPPTGGILSKCDHGPNQRCLKCMEQPKKEEPAKPPAPPQSQANPKTEKPAEPPKGQTKGCDHGPNQRCLKCMDTVEEKNEYVGKKQTNCTHGPNGRCINCIGNDTSNIKHLAFDDFIDRNYAKCKNHLPTQKCNNCCIDLNFDYKPKACKNHEPYPRGMCSSCMPPSISVKRQVYRHVDYAQVNNFSEIQNLIQFWFKTSKQRVAWLYGYYAEDPVYEKGVRAIVEALYEPPQENDFNFTNFRDDPFSNQTEEVAKALGLERVGWLFTTRSTDVFLSSEEMIRSAFLQERFKVQHPCGVVVSKQITMVLRGNEQGVSPEVYMISDQGQSLVRDQIIESPESRKFLKIKKDEKNKFSPKFLYMGKNVDQIEPDFFIVNVSYGQPKSNRCNVLVNADFPPANRPENQRNDNVRDYFRKYRMKGFQKFANFQLLLYIAKTRDLATAIRLANYVRDQRDPPDDFERDILQAYS